MFDYGLLNVNNSLGGEGRGGGGEERRAACVIRYINSQAEEEKVGVCKQLMDFFHSLSRVTEQEEEEQKEREQRLKLVFFLFGKISEKISEV